MRYLRVLIGWIERGTTIRGEAPPEHVYERIERILEIQEGAS